MSKPTPEEGSNSSSSPEPNTGSGRPSEKPTPPSSSESGSGQQTPAQAPGSSAPTPKPAGGPVPSEDQPTQAFKPFPGGTPAQKPEQKPEPKPAPEAAQAKPEQKPAPEAQRKPEQAGPNKPAEAGTSKPPMGTPRGSEEAKTTVLPPAAPKASAQSGPAGPQGPGPHQPTKPQSPAQAPGQQPGQSQGQNGPHPSSAPSGPAGDNTAVMPPVQQRPASGPGAAAGAGAAGAGAAAGAAGAAGAGNTAPPPGPGAGPGTGPASGPGAGSPAGAGGTTVAAAPVRERPKKKSNTAAWLVPVIAAAVVLILVIVGAIAHFIINRTVYGPDATAEKFVEALNEGDFEKARSFASFDVPENAYTDLIDDPKYAKAAGDTLSDAQVTSSERNGDDVTITVGYKQGEETKNIKLTGHKDGKQGLFFDKWKLNAPDLGTVKITAPAGAAVKINGEDFTASNPDTEYAVLPGTYEISTEGSKFVEATSAKTTVGFGGDDGGAELKVDPKPTKALGTEVQKAVDKRIDECKKAKEFEKAGCGPIKLPKKAQNTSIKPEKDVKLSTVSWKVTNPKVSANLDGGSGKGTFTTTKKGEATFTADSKSRGKNAWRLASPAPVIATGEFEIDGDSIKITKIYGW